VCDSEFVTRTSARSKNMAEMRMCKEKSAISPQRVIRSVFGFRSRVFGSADRMNLLPVEPNPRGSRTPSSQISLEYVIRSTLMKLIAAL